MYRPSKPLLAALAAALFLVPSAAAQVLLSWSNGVLGATVDYTIQAPAGTPYALLPSFTAGPTPLSLIDPNDPRVLAVGLDLQNSWNFGVVPIGGSKLVSYHLPPAAVLAGQVLHAQALTFPGSATLVKDISEPVFFSLSLPGQTLPAQNESAFARLFHSLTALPSGQVLVAGGQVPGAPPQFLNSVELFDPQLQTFKSLGVTLPAPRSHHSATLLNDGRVLLLGGINGSGVLTNGVIFNPVTLQFTPTAPMSSPRVLHTATLLNSGKVYVAGGAVQFNPAHPIGFPASFQNPTNSSETYDPASNTWTPGPQLPVGLATHQASLLGNGQVLITGGVEASPLALPVTTPRCYLYTPAGNALTPTASMPFAAQDHAQTELGNGDALVAGGANTNFATGQSQTLNTSSMYSQNNNTWTPPILMTIVIRDGKIIYIPRPGGPRHLLACGLQSLDLTTGNTVPQLAISNFDPQTSTWSVVGSENKPRNGADMAAFDDGRRVLILGSAGGVPPDKSADIFTIHP